MRAVIGVLVWCTKKYGKAMWLQGKCGKCLQAARYVLLVILSGFELLVTIVGMVLQGTGTNVNDTNNTPGVIFLATHAAEILLVIGIIPTLLLLPWKNYARESADEKSHRSENSTLQYLL